MDDERRRGDIARIFHAALQFEPEGRREFIRTECGEDQELRQRVESLLARDDSFSAESGATLGQRIGPYHLLTRLGAGGMGEVYLARDSRLGRQVALKVLPRSAGADPERRGRFLQEAKAASALNHPNIVIVYDVGEWADGLYLAMEHIDGNNLAARITGKPLPLSTALKYVIQVADALAAAHSAGIVHRDVKPANLMVTHNGQVKVLDFGIAKLIGPLPGGEALTTVTGGPWTREGDVVGTVAYMSPEQAEGRNVDARSDLFSLGMVLYEMLTGRHPFRRESALTTLSAILHDDAVPPARLNPAVPPELERVVMRCLEKDMARRFQNAADLKVALEWIERDHQAGDTIARASERQSLGRMSRLAIAVAVALLAIAVGAMHWLRTAPVQLPSPVQITNEVGIACNPALSRDGTLLAYASDRSGDGNLDIWVQQLPEGAPVRRTTDPADDGYPDFSPDGSAIVFERAGSGVFRVGTFSGSEALLAPGGLSPRFSPDGSRVAYWVGDPGRPSRSGAVFVVRPDGSAAKRVGAEFAYARFPLWASDGQHLLVQGAKPGDKGEDWWIVPVDGGPAFNTGALADLRSRGLSPHPGPGGWSGDLLVFSAIGQQTPHIWCMTLKATGWRLAASPRRVTSGAASDIEPSVAADGKVAFHSFYYRNNLWRVPLQDDGRGDAMKRLSTISAYDIRPSISADGRLLAFLSRRSKTLQVWVRDMEKGSETELTVGPEDKSSPAISADGSTVAYSVTEGGKPSIYTIPAGGARLGAARRVCEDCGEPADWTPDAKHILYTAGQLERVNLLNLASGKAAPILTHPEYGIRQPHLSPDGRWIAFVADSGDGRSRIFIGPFRAGEAIRPDEWIGATEGQTRDDKPRWLGNDSLIYFSDRDGFGCLWKQRLDPLAKRPTGKPLEVCPLHSYRLSLQTIYRSSFEIAVARNAIVLNLADSTGNIWQTILPGAR